MDSTTSTIPPSIKASSQSTVQNAISQSKLINSDESKVSLIILNSKFKSHFSIYLFTFPVFFSCFCVIRLKEEM